MHQIQKIARERILILDGAMGSMLQDYRLDEAGYRGARFADWPIRSKATTTCST